MARNSNYYFGRDSDGRQGNGSKSQGLASVTDDTIQNYLFGGLNTMASPLNTPYEDSPYLLNVRLDSSGAITKRPGTYVLGEENGTPQGMAAYPVTTGLGYNLLVAKNGTSIDIYEIINDVSTKVMSKSGVWSSLVAGVSADGLVLNEYEPRVVMTTGFNVPVQVKFTEQQQNVTGAASTSAVILEASRYADASTSNLLVFFDRVRQTGWGVSYNAGTRELTITGLPAYTGAHTVSVVMVNWQWYAEALFYYGERFHQTASRFHVTKADQNVAIPTLLQDEITDMSPTYPSFYPVYAYKSSAYNDTYIAAANREPSTYEHYCQGDGTSYVYAAGKKVNPAPFFITFGTINTGDPTPVHLVRYRPLKFNGNTGIRGDKLHVYINGTKTNQNTNPSVGSGTYGDYYLRGASWSVETSSTNKAPYISFDAATVIGLQRSATVELINSEPVYVGASALNVRGEYVDGAYIPCYGLGLYSNYNVGSFPRTLGLYQGRMVFGGFPNNPSLVVFSNTYDSVVPGKYYNYFQIDLTNTVLASDPLDVLIPSNTNDKIVKVAEWQGFLFIFTRQGVYRVHGGDQPLSKTSRYISFISKAGCVNHRCVITTTQALMYLSDQGVYEISPVIENGEYQAYEVSFKLRNQFGATSDPSVESLAWVAFDKTTQECYVGLPVPGLTKTAYRLLVCNTYQYSWAIWDTPNYFKSFLGTPYTDRQLGDSFLLFVCSKFSGGSPSDLILLKFNYSKYSDYSRKYISNGTPTDYLTPPLPQVTHTTVAGVREYSTHTPTTKQVFGFEPISLSVSLEDVTVTLNGNRLVFDVDFIKLPNNSIYLKADPGVATLVITLRRPVTDSVTGKTMYGVTSAQDIRHAMAWVDNVLKLENVGFTPKIVGDAYYATITASNNAVVITGQAYPTVYQSPSFTKQTLSFIKRLGHLYLYFDNRLGTSTYQVADVNALSGQLASSLVGSPKTRLDASICIMYDADAEGSITFDLYGFSDIVWDDAYFDIDPSASQFQHHVLFKEALFGVPYLFGVSVWSFDDSAFTLSGYQIDSKAASKKYIPWSS